MTDSCSPSKLEPGFAATYSKPSVLKTSTMKSEPGRSMMRDEMAGGSPVSAANCAADGSGAPDLVGADCAGSAATEGAATMAAAPAAAPLRKPRRSTCGLWDFAIVGLRNHVVPT